MLKKSISALEVQHQLGHKRYEPIWYMMHKIRADMGESDNKYELDGVIELEDAFFKTYSDKEQDKKNKQGRGTKEHNKDLIMANVDTKLGRSKKNKKSSAFRYVKMDVIPSSSAELINCSVALSITPTATVKSDGWPGFKKIKQVISKHIRNIVTPKEASKILPWVHTMISNAKRNLLGTNHQINDDYLQNYLNEFCYKTNRRYLGSDMFEDLLVAAVQDTEYGK